MSRGASEYDKPGPGSVALLGGLVLLAVAPLPRGSDYFAALIALEVVGLVILLLLAAGAAFSASRRVAGAPTHGLVALLLASPVVIAFVQLTPVPGAWWAQLPGHALYADALQALAVPLGAWRPVTISPDTTRASLLASIPLVAAFLLGYLASVPQFRMLMRVVIVVAFAQVLLGLLQLSGGQHSPFYFGMMTYGSPIGSLGTRNEFANLLALALAAHIWLAYDTVRYSMRFQPGAPLTQGRFDDRHAIAGWIAGGFVIVIGLLISQSRAGAAVGLLVGVGALGAASLRIFGPSRAWKVALALVGLLLLGAMSMVGWDLLTHRIGGNQLQSSLGFRGELWRSSWQAALVFFPFGSGWGTYDIAHRPFQTPAIAGYANHAHMDYLQMFVEGGALFLVFGACFAWLLAQRTARLLRDAWRERSLDRESMLAAICGIGLFGFLVHAAVDFPMRVPANAILAATLAGAFLRPLPARGLRQP